MDVSVVIINYNTRQMTSECIDSVAAETNGIDYEIILVDNASTDGSKEFFEKDQRVKYIYSDTNKGFGAGNNLGAKHARGKYIFLLNSDTLLCNNAIKMLFNFSESLSTPCVCGAWLLDKAGKLNVSEVSFPRMNILEFFRSKFTKKVIPDPTQTKEVDVVCGADMFLQKHSFEQVGGFDEQIFMYGDEVELQYRLRQNDIPRYVIPGPEIIHFGGGSAYNLTSNHLHSHFFFLKKHMSRFNYYTARTYYAVNFLLRKLLSKPSVNLKDAFMSI